MWSIKHCGIFITSISRIYLETRFLCLLLPINFSITKRGLHKRRHKEFFQCKKVLFQITKSTNAEKIAVVTASATPSWGTIETFVKKFWIQFRWITLRVSRPCMQGKAMVVYELTRNIWKYYFDNPYLRHFNVF